MSEPRTEPKQYVVAHLQHALADDPRLHTLDVRVKVVGDRILLTGSVETPERLAAVDEVARAHAGELEVRNEVSVIGYDAAPHEEYLS